jgi:hypothetical protein
MGMRDTEEMREGRCALFGVGIRACTARGSVTPMGYMVCKGFPGQTNSMWISMVMYSRVVHTLGHDGWRRHWLLISQLTSSRLFKMPCAFYSHVSRVYIITSSRLATHEAISTMSPPIQIPIFLKAIF